MDINSSIERRYSFNIAQTNPVAESTHLGSSFSWGSSMSMRPRSNSSLCLNNTYSPGKSKNITKIDARIAADVQSKGLASRIVKYHESGARLNRSISAHNLYSKPGQFPAVTLKKTELPYRATKQELSMIRIPPPKKSMFYGNTISSLLKSNSVVGLKTKRTEENRPIIHPPPTESDMAPTRSVLDVLKEISRKRINSDDLETDETSKKYCNRVSDFIDAGACATSTATVANTVPSTNQRFKRQRDCITPQKYVDRSEVKTSPEQAKKRICNYNNDITSSLSSSIKSKCNKKKRASNLLNHTIPSNLESHETQKTKIQCFHDQNKNNDQTDIGLENLKNNSSKIESVKPISDEAKSGVICPIIQSDSSNILNGKVSTNEKQHVNKPPLTLFNKNYEVEVEKDSRVSICKEDEVNNFDEYAGIPFVKPKMSISGLKNPVLERTQKCKLALMLSGLRGELYKNTDKDTTDSSIEELKQQQQKVEDKKLNIKENISISALKSVSTVTTTLTTATSSCNLNSNTGILANANTSSDSTTNTTTNVVQATTIPSKTLSPLVGLKLTQIKPSIANDSTTTNDSKIIDTSTKNSVPVLGGFSFGGGTNTNISTVFSAVTSKSSISPASTVSNASNKISLPTTKDSALLCPMPSANSLSSEEKKLSLPNVSSSTTDLKPANNFVFDNNVKPLTTTITNISKTSEGGGTLLFSNGTTKPTSSFNFSIPLQTSIKPLSSLTTSTTTASTISLNTGFSKTINSGVTTTPNFTSIKPTISNFSAKENQMSEPSVAVTKVSTENSSASTFSSQTTATTVSTFNASNNTGIPIQSSNSSFSFATLSKTQNSASDDKKNSDQTSKGNNIFNANLSTVFSASNLKPSASAPLFGSSNNNTEKNIFGSSNTATPVFGTSNAASTPVFGTNSFKNDSQVFGSCAENKSSPFGGSSTSNSISTSFNFGTKTSDTKTANNPNTLGGFSFGSTISKTAEGGTFGFGNTIKPTAAKSAGNIFGTVSTTDPENKTFTFGSTSNKTENNSAPSGGFSFSAAAAPKPTTFTFGASGNSTANFSFGGVTSPLSTETSNNKAFSFGTQQTQHPQPQLSMPVTNSASNIFSSPAPSKTVPPPAFNFNSVSSANLQQSVQLTNNVFAPSPSNITTGPGDRPIRRATRRLQK